MCAILVTECAQKCALYMYILQHSALLKFKHYNYVNCCIETAELLNYNKKYKSNIDLPALESVVWVPQRKETLSWIRGMC